MNSNYTLVLSAKKKGLLRTSKKISIGILYTGEPQLTNLIESLIVSFDKLNISEISILLLVNHSNYEAHQKLYEWLNIKKADYRVKLDADMGIEDWTINKLINSTSRKRVIYPILDCITNSIIYGVHYIPPNHLIS